MHLKIQLNLSGRRSGGPGALLLLLLVRFATLATPFANGRGVAAHEQIQQDHSIVRDDELATKQTSPTEAAERHETARKCKPMLNIVLPQVRQRQVDLSAQTAQIEPLAAGQLVGDKRTATAQHGLPDSFSFAIDDIDMPLAQSNSALQSAMRLFSTFESQLDSAGADQDGEQQATRQNSIKFVANRLTISGLNLTMLNFHFYAASQPKFSLGVNIGNATLTGQFFYDGPTPSLMGGDLVSKLAGHYRMSIDNVLVTASSNLTKQRDIVDDATDDRRHSSTDSHLQLPYKLTTNDFKMEISNLGYISIDILDARDSSKPTSNYVLRMLQRVLQKTIKRTYNQFEGFIRSTLGAEGRRLVDCELTRFSPILKENQQTPLELDHTRLNQSDSSIEANNLDDLARIISSEIRNSRLDRVPMPNFDYQRSVLGTSALIVFTNGSLSGLDNLRLLGETKVKLQEEHLIVNASLGWFNLRPQYNWTLYLGNSAHLIAQQLDSAQRQQQQQHHDHQTNSTTTPPAVVKPIARGFVAANIKAIEFDTLVSRSLSQSQSRVIVDELTIRRLDGPKMDIGGLPGMNRLTRGTVNFFMARLKQRLVGSIQPALKHELERVLNRLAMFN